ncbi:MAG TPA: class I SAM-dependent methyltransferase [Candidatus Acidoferrum sp.]|jgi:SAM-dependent methyltransferase|nr:class I SAM-dependent methyltransferase [Candidatus Acidoferrum sp.]
MRPAVESYSVTAKYYDGAYAAKQDLVDLPFYVELAEQTGGPILEVACGTGRVLLPIARNGTEIHGVDNSLPMLKILENSLAREPQDVRRKVTLHEGDMRDFRLGARFPLVIIPFRPMQHMHTVEDQVSALTTAVSHLNEDGVLAFDVFYPKFDVIAARMGEEVLEFEWSQGPDSAKVVRRYFRKESVDKINQIFYFTFIYRTYHAGELILEETEAVKLSYFTYPHLRALFLLAGLEPVAEYGSFAKTSLDNSAEQMIFLLHKARP